MSVQLFIKIVRITDRKTTLLLSKFDHGSFIFFQLFRSYDDLWQLVGTVRRFYSLDSISKGSTETMISQPPRKLLNLATFIGHLAHSDTENASYSLASKTSSRAFLSTFGNISYSCRLLILDERSPVLEGRF